MKKWLTNQRFWFFTGASLALMGLMFTAPLVVSVVDKDPGCLSFLLVIPSFIRIILAVLLFCSVFLGGALTGIEGHFNERTVTYFKKKFNQIEEEFKYVKGLFYETEKRVARAKKEQERLIEDNVSSPADIDKKKREVSSSCREVAFWATMSQVRARLQQYFSEKLIIWHNEDVDDDYCEIGIGGTRYWWGMDRKILKVNWPWGFTDLSLNLYPTCEEQIAIVKEEMKRYKEQFKKEDKRKVNIKLTLHVKHGFSKTRERVTKTAEKKVAKISPRLRFPCKEDSCPQHDFSKEVARTLFGKLPVKDGVRTLYLKTLECALCGKKKIENEWGEYVKMELEEQF